MPEESTLELLEGLDAALELDRLEEVLMTKDPSAVFELCQSLHQGEEDSSWHEIGNDLDHNELACDIIENFVEPTSQNNKQAYEQIKTYIMELPAL